MITLFAKRFADEEPSVARAAVHQAGHVIAALEMRHHLPCVSLFSLDTECDHFPLTHLAVKRRRSVQSLVHHCRWWEQTAIVMMAGREAETAFGIHLRGDVTEDDLRRAERALAQVCETTQELDATFTRLRRIAKEIVLRERRVVLAIADAMARRLILDSADILRISSRS